MLSWSFGRVSNNSSTALTTRSHTAPPVDVAALEHGVGLHGGVDGRVSADETQRSNTLAVVLT